LFHAPIVINQRALNGNGGGHWTARRCAKVKPERRNLAFKIILGTSAGRAGYPLPTAVANPRVLIDRDGAHGVTHPTCPKVAKNCYSSRQYDRLSAPLTSPRFANIRKELGIDARKSPFHAGFLLVGTAALRRPRRRAQRQATESDEARRILNPVPSALTGGGIAARWPLPVPEFGLSLSAI